METLLRHPTRLLQINPLFVSATATRLAQLAAVSSLLDPFFGDLSFGFRRRFSPSVLAVAALPDLLRKAISVVSAPAFLSGVWMVRLSPASFEGLFC